MDNNSPSGPFDRRILDWISRVSQHPYPPPPMSNYVSSDDDGATPAMPAKNTGARKNKRPRADTTLSATAIPNNPTSPMEVSSAQSKSQTAPSTSASVSKAPSDVESTAPSAVSARRKPRKKKKVIQGSDGERLETTAEARLNAPNQETERQECIARIRSSAAKAVYVRYEDPVLLEVPGKKRSTHYGFKCKSCSELIPRGIGGMDTSNLINHTNRCSAEAAQKTRDLLSMGVTSSIHLSPEMVRELFALWFARHSRPFSMVGDEYQTELLHPDARRHAPSRVLISKDVKRLYMSTQQQIVELFAAHKGVFHVALDLCQSANGHDFLGIVVFWASAASGPMKIERLVIECLNFQGSHTGAALAKTVLKVLRKFQIEDRVWGMVCDNASNNDSMIKLLGERDLKRMKGPESGVHCAAHVMNLVAQAMLGLLRQKRREITPDHYEEDDDEEEKEEWPSDDEDEAEEGAEDADADTDAEDNGQGVSAMLDGDLDGDEALEELDLDLEVEDINLPPIEKGSSAEKELIKAALVYWRLSKTAHKLRYCPAAKEVFREACTEKAVEHPFNVRRDVITRWGSTNRMFEDGLRLFAAILVYQQNRRYTPVTRTFRADDYGILKEIVGLLKPLSVVSDILCRGGVPALAELIVHFDCLTQEYTEIALDEERPLFIRHCALIAIAVLNKYYGKTDDSILHRCAMLVHPSVRVTYMKNAGWPQSWIDEAVDILVAEWKKHYRSKTATKDVPAQANQFAYSTYLQRMYPTAGKSSRSSVCPVREFVNAPPVLEPPHNGQPVLCNPLLWWHGQRTVGNEWDGLTQLAIDVLSCPATSVDVERAFSLLSNIVTKRRHNLSAQTIQATASLASYAKAGLVKRGALGQILRQEKAKKKADRGKGKAKAKAS